MESNKSQEAETFESSNENQVNKWGGARPGAGRPRHSKNPDTKEREAALKHFKKRVTRNTDRLFNAQMGLAEGVSMVFKIEKDDKGNNKKPELVTDQDTISRFIDECGGYEGQLDGNTYYFVTTKMPDNKAIDSLLDRTYGKAKDKVDVTSDDKPIQSPAIVSLVRPRNAPAQDETTTSN